MNLIQNFQFSHNQLINDEIGSGLAESESVHRIKVTQAYASKNNENRLNEQI